MYKKFELPLKNENKWMNDGKTFVILYIICLNLLTMTEKPTY